MAMRLLVILLVTGDISADFQSDPEQFDVDNFIIEDRKEKGHGTVVKDLRSDDVEDDFDEQGYDDNVAEDLRSAEDELQDLNEKGNGIVVKDLQSDDVEEDLDEQGYDDNVAEDLRSNEHDVQDGADGAYVRLAYLQVGQGSCCDGAGKQTAHYFKASSSYLECRAKCNEDTNCQAWEIDNKKRTCFIFTPGGDLANSEGWLKQPGNGATTITSIHRKNGGILCMRKTVASVTRIGEGECAAAAKKLFPQLLPGLGPRTQYWKKVISASGCTNQCRRDSACTHYEWKHGDSSCTRYCNDAGTAEKPALCVVFTPQGSIEPSGWSTSLPDGKRICTRKRQPTYLTYFDRVASKCPWLKSNTWKTYPVDESNCESAVETVFPNGKTQAENKGLVKLDAGDWKDKPGFCSYKSFTSGTSSDNKAYFNRKLDNKNQMSGGRNGKFMYSIVCSDTKAAAPYLHLGSGACRDGQGKYTSHSYKDEVSKIECKNVCSRDVTCTHYNWFKGKKKCIMYTPHASVGPSGWTFVKGQDGVKRIRQGTGSGDATECMEKKKPATIYIGTRGKCVDAAGKHTDFYTMKVGMSVCGLQCLKDVTCTHYSYKSPNGCTVYTTKGGLTTSRPQDAKVTRGNGATTITKGDGDQKTYCRRKRKVAGYVAGSKGSDKCPAKTSHVRKHLCRYAVLNSLCNTDTRGHTICKLQGKTTLDTGDSSGKPFGCSIGPENQPYYNTKVTGKNDGKFTPVCLADALAKAPTPDATAARTQAATPDGTPAQPPAATPALTPPPTQASPSANTKTTYVEGKISGSDDETEMKTTEAAAQSACNADGSCVGYYKFTKSNPASYILLKKGNSEWVTGTYYLKTNGKWIKIKAMGQFVGSVKVKNLAGSALADTLSSTLFDDVEANTKVPTSSDEEERRKVDALEESAPTQTIMRKHRKQGEVSLAVDDRGEVTVASMQEDPEQ